MPLLFAVPAALALSLFILVRLSRKRARDRLRPIFRQGLDELVRAARGWPGSEYDLVDYDTDRHPDPDAPWRTLTLRPGKDVAWRIQIRGDRAYSFELTRKGQPKLRYPEAWNFSREPWIAPQVADLLAAIAALPPPRTSDEYLQKMKDEHAAYMARLDADRARRRQDEAARGPSFPSLDDPMDDMD